MILGAVAAIIQKNLKRPLAYSSIGHVGYVLAGIATGVIQATKALSFILPFFNLRNYEYWCLFVPLFF